MARGNDEPEHTQDPPSLEKRDARPTDDDLAETLEIDAVVDGAEAAEDFEPAPSPPPRPPRERKQVIKAGETSDADPTGEKAEKEAARERRKRLKKSKAPWWELPLLVAIAITVAVLIKSFVVQPFYIPSESMEKTLHGCTGCVGDRVIVNKPIYHLRDPHPGDIVVFRAPAGWEPPPIARSNNPVRWFGQLIGFVPPDEKDLIKRVIAVGGQTIQCCDAQGRVQVNDDGGTTWRSLNETYIFEDSPWDPKNRPGEGEAEGNDSRTFGPVTIPDGKLWVMGDHRSDSEDSRWHYLHDFRGDAEMSTVPVDAVIGKAVVIAWPPSRWDTLGTPETFKQKAQAVGSAVPVAGAALAVLPLYFVRRRRRG